MSEKELDYSIFAEMTIPELEEASASLLEESGDAELELLFEKTWNFQKGKGAETIAKGSKSNDPKDVDGKDEDGEDIEDDDDEDDKPKAKEGSAADKMAALRSMKKGSKKAVKDEECKNEDAEIFGEDAAADKLQRTKDAYARERAYSKSQMDPIRAKEAKDAADKLQRTKDANARERAYANRKNEDAEIFGEDVDIDLTKFFKEDAEMETIDGSLEDLESFLEDYEIFME